MFSGWLIKKPKTLWPLFMNGVELSQDYRATMRRPLSPGTHLLFLKVTGAHLAHFMPLISFDTPWKHQLGSGFLMFSGGIKETGMKWVNRSRKDERMSQTWRHRMVKMFGNEAIFLFKHWVEISSSNYKLLTSNTY